MPIVDKVPKTMVKHESCNSLISILSNSNSDEESKRNSSDLDSVTSHFSDTQSEIVKKYQAMAKKEKEKSKFYNTDP